LSFLTIQYNILFAEHSGYRQAENQKCWMALGHAISCCCKL